MTSPIFRRLAPALVAGLLAAATGAHAERTGRSGDPSTGSSELSAFLTVVSVAGAPLLVEGASELVVRGVQASADGVGWVVQNGVDGSKAVLRFSGQAIGASAIGVGTILTVTATGSGWVLGAAGKAVAFVPNELGRALLHDEKVSS